MFGGDLINNQCLCYFQSCIPVIPDYHFTQSLFFRTLQSIQNAAAPPQYTQLWQEHSVALLPQLYSPTNVSQLPRHAFTDSSVLTGHQVMERPAKKYPPTVLRLACIEDCKEENKTHTSLLPRFEMAAILCGLPAVLLLVTRDWSREPRW